MVFKLLQLNTLDSVQDPRILWRRNTNQALIFSDNQDEKTDFYNTKESKPIHPLQQNQEGHLRKGQVILTNQVWNGKRISKNKSVYFMDVGEKRMVTYNLKPWAHHQISNTMKTEGSSFNSQRPSMENALSLWGEFSKLNTKQDSNSNPVHFREQPSFQYKKNILKWIRSQTSIQSQTFELPYYFYENKQRNNKRTYSAPHVTKQLMYYNTAWNWLNNSWQSGQNVTGRIGRSLRNAGSCVLLGGFVGFLPKRESLMRKAPLAHYRGGLVSVKPLSLRYQNLNLVVSRDKAIQSVWYRFSHRKFA